MNRIRIKLTGVTRPDDARFAVQSGVDIVACVFFARSPRYVSPSTAAAIRHELDPSTAFHGIFVDTPVPLVQRVAEQCKLDRIQLFGAESREDVEALGDIACKAVSAGTPAAVDEALRRFVGRRARRSAEPALLLHLTGSVARRFDLCAPIAERVAVMLASSELGAGTAGEAARARPWALDVWDGVEVEPGVLDRARLVAFVDAVRAAEAAPTSG